MATAEDAASVLEQFVQDVANLPAEIAHLLEEIQAKDRNIHESRTCIASKDATIQKWIKMNGVQPHPKEEACCKVVFDSFDKAQALQEEKVALSDKASVLLDRQIKRLDFKIRDLQNEGSIQPDPQLPSLLNNPTPTTRFPSLSASATGYSTPLHPLSGNAAGPSTTIANNPLTRLVQPSSHQRQPSPLPSSSTASAIASHNLASVRHNRSPSTDPKRRRLPHHLSIPTTSSSLRQSSLGPGTPKGGLDGASRGSSAGPPRPFNKKAPNRASTGAPPHQRIGHLNPTTTNNKKSSSRRRGQKQKSSTPASNDADSIMESAVEEENEDEDVEMGEGEEEEGEGDDKKYCFCQSVSYGNMVACDNEGCPYEWFHWSCVGVTREPAGKWFCPECRGQKGRSRGAGE